MNGGKYLVGFAVLLLTSMLVVPGVAHAQADTVETYETVDECMASLNLHINDMSRTCWGTEGAWAPMQSDFGGTNWSMSDDDFGALTFFIAIGVMWMLIPLGIAVWLAIDRDESIGWAVLLTLVLGWIGLAIVYFGQSNTRDMATGLAQRATEPRPPTGQSWSHAPPPATTTSSPAAVAVATDAGDTDVKARLARIDDLLRDGLITEAEHGEQRRRILDSI